MLFKKSVLNIHWKTPVLEPLFNKATDMLAFNFIKQRLQLRCEY